MKQLFKYMSEPRDLFSQGFIRLSQPAALNDPFEAMFCRDSLEKLASKFDDTKARDPEFGGLPFSDYVGCRMNNIGVICFSENKENLLMWAHYANEHKGIVVCVNAGTVGKSIFHDLFRADAYINSSWSEEYSPFDGRPKPVSYRKGLKYRNDRFDYDYSYISAEGADRILYEVFMQKCDEWIYEQEHRVVLRLEQADRVIINSVDLLDAIKIKEKILSSSYTSMDSRTGRVIIDLMNIKDKSERLFVSMALTKLSASSDVLYLMKLSASCINGCLLGLRTEVRKEDVTEGHASTIGYMGVWEAKKSIGYYGLEFKEV